MLDIFRSQTKNPFLWLILVIIILAFVLTFNTSGPLQGGGGVEVAPMVEVYGSAIDNRELSLAMSLSADPPPPGVSAFEKLQANNRYEKSRLLFSGVPSPLISMTPFDGEVPPIKIEKVMVEMIESLLVSREAAAKGLEVSDAELNARVMRLQRIFGTTFTDKQGNFDSRKYDIFVRFQLNASKSLLETMLRREILRDKMAHIVTSGVLVTDAELDAIDLAESQRPKLQYIAVDAANARAAIKPTDEEIAQWAGQHDKEIAAAYEAAGETYNKPEKYSLRGILLKAEPKDMLAAETDAAKKAAGEQGWTDKKAAADALRAELDKAWKGELAIAGPIKAEGDDKAADPGEKKITEVPAEERASWLTAHFTRVAADKTEHALTKDVGGQFIDDKSADALKRAPFGDAVAAAVASATPGTLVGPVEGSHGWWILLVDKKIEAVSKPLESVKLEIAAGLLKEERAAGELDAIANTVVALAQKTPDKSLEDVAKAWNEQTTGSAEGPLSAATAGPIGRSPTSAMTGGLQAMLGLPSQEADPNDIPGIGKAPEIVAAVWKLKADAPVAGSIFKSEDGKTRYIVRLDPPATDKDEATVKAEKKTREGLRDMVQSMRKVAVWQAYVRKLREAAEAAGEIERTDAWSQILASERQRYLDALKRAGAKQAGAGSPLNIQLGGGSQQIDLGGAPPAEKPEAAPAEQAAPAGDKPAE